MLVHSYAAALRRAVRSIPVANYIRRSVLPPALAALRPALLAGLLLQMAGCAHTPPAPSTDWRYPEGPSWGARCLAAPPPQQSPIDFTRVTTTPRTATVVVGQSAFSPPDQNVAFAPTPGPSVTISAGADESGAAVAYTVIGFHFHDGHEHVIAGNPTLEMHIKAVDRNGATAVFGALWKPVAGSTADPVLLRAYESLTAPPGRLVPVDVSPVLLHFGRQPFYNYVGSLTTPPCSPDIRWFVLQSPLVTDPNSITQLVSALQSRGMPDDNVRAAKPLASPPPPIYLVTPR